MDATTSKKNKNIIILLFLLLLISSIGNIVFYKQKSTITQESKFTTEELDSVVNVKVKLERELKSTADELEKYKGISTKLDSLVSEANEKIKIQEKKIAELTKNAKNSKELTAQLQTEIENLKKLKDEYLEKIDELLMTNTQLNFQNLSLNITISNLQNQVNNLKGKVAIGEQLIADNIIVKPIKKNLFGKYTETTMAKKTKKLEICFDVLENKLIPPAQQKIFVRIMTPEGATIYEELAGSGNTNNPEFNVKMSYTMLEEIDYINERYNVCVEWEGTEKYKAGTYILILYTEKNKMGTTSFNLR